MTDTTKTSANPVASAPAAHDIAVPSVSEAEHAVVVALEQVVLNIPGVYALGDPVTRMIGVARERITGRQHVAGITVSAEPPALHVSVSLVAEYPAGVTVLADTVRSGIAAALADDHTGPLHIDVTVTDIHGPFDVIVDEDEDPGTDPLAEPTDRETV